MRSGHCLRTENGLSWLTARSRRGSSRRRILKTSSFMLLLIPSQPSMRMTLTRRGRRRRPQKFRQLVVTRRLIKFRVVLLLFHRLKMVTRPCSGLHRSVLKLNARNSGPPVALVRAKKLHVAHRRRVTSIKLRLTQLGKCFSPRPGTRRLSRLTLFSVLVISNLVKLFAPRTINLFRGRSVFIGP